MTTYKYCLGDKVEIIKGRLKGETGKVIGKTNLNMDYRIIVLRDNNRARDISLGFYPEQLRRIDK